ncbi:MAG: type II toxin-antitoxin system RelB/DinJ family antitoxin [Rhodobacteraceae bacterium]|nr:type II toxin-antitoxin system RelB/DinJ family antitoxin [Paracoccaceae bacterium]
MDDRILRIAVWASIDEKTGGKATAVLNETGVTVSDAFRLTMKGAAAEKKTAV